VVIAENVGGSVSGFAARMNRTAQALGMRSTSFRNPHGLPNASQTSTARDFVKLAVALQDRFPRYYKFFSARSFTYKGVRHRNHNRLLGSVQGVDGIKTGYTRASGFNLVSNVRRDGRHIVAVVMGGRTASSRDAHMRELIAKYLPAAKRGNRTAEPVVADAVSVEAPVEESVAAVDVRTPRPRPEQEEPAPLAYAAMPQPRDVVAAAMAQPAAPQGDLSDAGDEVASDPIAERISGATEVAELAYAEPGKPDDADPIARRLAEMARMRAGAQAGAPRTLPPAQDIVAAPRAAPTANPDAGEAGWHIQIGAVPTQTGADELIETAKASMGTVLASLQPFTQPVKKDGTTLYRARFAGLSDKEAARELCAKLESKSIKCLAVPN
jgi:D-alanyl-D-alanine carboxypeptidase